jgi:hypothetical protein
MAGATRAAQLLLARNVMATTYRLVRCMQGGSRSESIRRLMAERHRHLAELARYVNASAGVGSLAAISAAVTESDRTLETLLG